MSFAAELSPCGSLSERTRNPILGFDFMQCIHPHETISDAVSNFKGYYLLLLSAGRHSGFPRARIVIPVTTHAHGQARYSMEEER
jgi:hypothetical protein